MRKLSRNIIHGFATTAAIFLGTIALAAAQVQVCGLTGKEATPCCCAEKDGKLVCGYTGKVLDKCCCSVKSNPQPRENQ